MNTLLAILKVTDTILDVTLAGGLYHRFPCRHPPPPPPPSRDLYFCEYYALPSRIFRGLFTRVVQVRLPDCFWWGSSLDCKTVRICAYSSTREQSNERSGTRLKTESTRPTGVWGSRASRVGLLLHALPISLLILREKPTLLQSSSLQVLNRSNELWMPPNVIVN